MAKRNSVSKINPFSYPRARLVRETSTPAELILTVSELISKEKFKQLNSSMGIGEVRSAYEFREHGIFMGTATRLAQEGVVWKLVVDSHDCVVALPFKVPPTLTETE